MNILFKFLYYFITTKLPNSYFPGGQFFNFARIFTIKNFIKIGQHCKIQKNVYIGNNVTIGDYCQINENVKLRNVSIGNYVLIAPGVSIIGYDHEFKDIKTPIMFQGEIEKKIIIDDDVWIGTNVIILKGVNLKKGCIIGAGAVITKDCEKYSIYGGIPAKLIKKRNSI